MTPGNGDYCCCSVTKSCLTLCNPVNCSLWGFPVLHVSCSLLILISIESVSQVSHPTISSSVISFSCFQSFPASGSFPMSWCFTSSGQSIGDSTSASASVLPVDIRDWLPLELTGLISLQVLSRVFSSTAIQKHQFFSAQPSLWSSSHICTWLLEKPYLWQYGPLLTKWCLCF